MCLIEHINCQLQKAPLDQASLVQASYGELRMEVKLTDWNRLGCLLDKLNLEANHGRKLNYHPARIETRVNYLDERLAVIENEGEAGRVILRSKPPRLDGDVCSFFEMVLNQGKALSLVRYKHDPQRRERVRVPAPLSRDTLDRLIRDLVELTLEN
jgi:hypothetical protein